ncbi:MAG TPA: hypothetical protein VIM84_01960, partial [Gemmatimonadales bacterium]
RRGRTAPGQRHDREALPGPRRGDRVKRTAPQAVSRFLRRHGYNPSSGSGWHGLTCTRSGAEVRVRVWQRVDWGFPTSADVAVAAEIATLLRANKYIVRYVDGSHVLYVEGR